MKISNWRLFFSAFVSLTSVFAYAEGDPEAYRKLVLAVRPKGTFQIPLSSGKEGALISYAFKLGEPRFEKPLFSPFFLNGETDRYYVDFWDKIALEDGSQLSVNGDLIPLTCLYVKGHDNRFSKKDSPLIPDFTLSVYLVANDYTCTGPINPGWPSNGLKQETWDTYVYYEIKDPTIMLPTEVKVRYRWEERPLILVDKGGFDQ